MEKNQNKKKKSHIQAPYILHDESKRMKQEGFEARIIVTIRTAGEIPHCLQLQA
jgi:hypothetical protein